MSYLNDTFSDTITIIGTGNYGQGLAKRLLKFGFKVVFGSRYPDENFIKDNFSQTNVSSIFVYSIKDAWTYSDKIVIFAIRPSAYEFVLRQIFNEKNKLSQDDEKIIIDVSNNEQTSLHVNNKRQIGIDVGSNAEMLQMLLNEYSGHNLNTVVKAFNSISAYSMSCEYADRTVQMIPIASDNSSAKECIIQFCRRLGFHGYEVGTLKHSHQLENLNDKTFPEWINPSVFSILFTIFNSIWYFWYSYASNAKYKNLSDYYKAFSLIGYLNRLFAFTSINLLCYVYLAGLIAALYQLSYGTKNRKFPKYLDIWLKSRKHLGLWAFALASLHVILSVCTLDAGHYSPWYKQVKLTNMTVLKLPTLTFHGELNILSGIFAYFFMCLLALSSINSISSSLNMSEWKLVQSKGGYACLIFSLLHVVVMFLRFILERSIHNYTNKHILTRVKLFTTILPSLTLILKFMLTYIRPLNRRIENIRNGSYDIITKKRFYKTVINGANDEFRI